MKQFVIGLPSPASIPRAAHPAYHRLETVIRHLGGKVENHPPNGSRRRLDVAIEAPGVTRVDRGKGFRCAPLREGFEIVSSGENRWTVRTQGGIGLALHEIAHQLLASDSEETGPALSPMALYPRVPTRAIRLSSAVWGELNWDAMIESYSMLGINAFVLDCLEMPQEERTISNEGGTNGWEPRLHTVLERIGRGGGTRMAVLPVELDLADDGVTPEATGRTPVCRQIPSNRRRLLHRFEAILRRLPEIEAVGLAVTDWGRCRCEACRRVGFAEEVAYYLRGYTSILKRYAPSCDCWLLPDDRMWGLLQEVGSQIPETLKVLTPPASRAKPGENAVWESGRNAPVGERFDLTAPFSGSLLDHETVARTLTRWEESQTPEWAVAEIESVLPPALASFEVLTWEYRGKRDSPEAWCYRKVLPPHEWSRWKWWKQANDLLGVGLAGEARRGPLGKRGRFQTNLRSVPWTAPDGLGQSSPETVRATLDQLAREVPRTLRILPLDTPHLMDEVGRAAKRWLGEEELRSIFERLEDIPEGSPLSPGILSRAIKIQELLEAWNEEPWGEAFSSAEIHCLEDLRLHLSLMASEWIRKRTWSCADLPPLWLQSELCSRPIRTLFAEIRSASPEITVAKK